MGYTSGSSLRGQGSIPFADVYILGIFFFFFFLKKNFKVLVGNLQAS